MKHLKLSSIALIIPDFDYGGEEKRVVFFANNYLEYFNKVYVISPYGKSSALLNPEIFQIAIDVRDYRSIPKVLSILKKNRITFLQGHKRATMPYLFLAQLFLKIHCVFNFDNIYLKGNLIFKYLTPKNIIYLSNILKDFYEPYYPRRKNLVINMGGDFYKRYSNDEILVAKKALCLTNEFVILSLGRLSEQKNHKLLLEGLKAFKNVNFVCLIVGTGPCLDKLRNLVVNNNLQDKIRFLGHRGDIENLLNVADVLVQSSIFEGFPNVLIEAASIGLPIIATNVGSSKTLIHGNGILINSGNIGELIIAIQDVIKKTVLYKEEALQFKRSEFFKQFHVDNMLKNYIKYYETVEL